MVDSRSSGGTSIRGTSASFVVSAGRNVNGAAAGFRVDLEGCGEGEGGVSRVGNVPASGNVKSSSSDSSMCLSQAGGRPVESSNISCTSSIPSDALCCTATSLSSVLTEVLGDGALHETVKQNKT